MIARIPDRVSAGKALASQLDAYGGTDAVVLGLPRGGVPVAGEVARALGLPLGVMPVRKIGLPHQPELALGAIAGPEGDATWVNRDVAASANIKLDDIPKLAAPARAELARRNKLWARAGGQPDLAGRPLLLIDDGMATGATMKAAIMAAKRARASRIIVATPVAAPDTMNEIGAMVDEIYCLSAPSPFYAVGAHYVHFPQVSDSQVERILEAAKDRMAHKNADGGAHNAMC